MEKHDDMAWLQEYEELLFGFSRTQETMARACEMKLQHMPTYLYKYRACNENTLAALDGDFLYSSPPREFNDIFEGPIEIVFEDAKNNFLQKSYDNLRSEFPFLPKRTINSSTDYLESISMAFGGSLQELKSDALLCEQIEFLQNKMDTVVFDHINYQIDNARNRYNICCFCSEYNNPLMWAYYADNQKGFCIGYDIKAQNNNLTHLTFPVIYKNNCNWVIHDVDEINGSDCMHMLTIKSEKWQHENEWRTFFMPSPHSRREPMPVAKEVYLGAKIERAYEIQIREICKKKKIKLFKMVPQMSNQRLVEVPMEE